MRTNLVALALFMAVGIDQGFASEFGDGQDGVLEGVGREGKPEDDQDPDGHGTDAERQAARRRSNKFIDTSCFRDLKALGSADSPQMESEGEGTTEYYASFKTIVNPKTSEDMIDRISCSENEVEIVFNERPARYKLGDMFPTDATLVVECDGVGSAFESDIKIDGVSFLQIQSATMRGRVVTINGVGTTYDGLFEEMHTTYTTTLGNSRRRLEDTIILDPFTIVDTTYTYGAFELQAFAQAGIDGTVTYDRDWQWWRGRLILTATASAELVFNADFDLAFTGAMNEEFSFEEENPTRTEIPGAGFTVNIPSAVRAFLEECCGIVLLPSYSFGFFMAGPLFFQGQVDVPVPFQTGSSVAMTSGIKDFEASVTLTSSSITANFDLTRDDPPSTIVEVQEPGPNIEAEINLNLYAGTRHQLIMSMTGFAELAVSIKEGVEVWAMYHDPPFSPQVATSGGAETFGCSDCHYIQMGMNELIKEPQAEYWNLLTNEYGSLTMQSVELRHDLYMQCLFTIACTVRAYTCCEDRQPFDFLERRRCPDGSTDCDCPGNDCCLVCWTTLNGGRKLEGVVGGGGIGWEESKPVFGLRH